jgi:hypothetical protein
MFALIMVLKLAEESGPVRVHTRSVVATQGNVRLSRKRTLIALCDYDQDSPK